MTVHTRTLAYDEFEALIAWDDAIAGARPGVLVAHTVRGRSGFEEEKARALAAMGYVGFALDLYGRENLGRPLDESRSRMQELLADRPLLQSRMVAALEQLSAIDEVDPGQLAAIGFCFGGLCVLDLARTGADLAGVASFHGLLTTPGNTAGNRVRAKALVMHGWDDPLAPPGDVLALAEELSAMGADWQIHGYGGTAHGFTNPQAADPGHGLQYQADADRRSWNSLRSFLLELFDPNLKERES